MGGFEGGFEGRAHGADGRSGAGEGKIVRWAAFLSAEVMAEWWRYLSCAATRPLAPAWALMRGGVGG